MGFYVTLNGLKDVGNMAKMEERLDSIVERYNEINEE